MNIVVLKGRLVRDVEPKETASGKKVARFTLAVDRPKVKGQEKSEADFITCVAFDLRAEVIERNFHKGDAILINGTMRTGSYEKDGRKVYTTDVWVNGFDFCGSKSTASTSTTTSSSGFGSAFDEDIPF